MRNILFFLILSFLVLGCFAQNKKPNTDLKATDLSFINNRTLKHQIVILACDTCAPISNIGRRVRVTLSEKNELKVKQIAPETWIILLNNKKSDWAANLILYSLYNKDAFFLSRYDERELWIKHIKEEDLDFWKKKFMK